jgi:hypothetical protein
MVRSDANGRRWYGAVEEPDLASVDVGQRPGGVEDLALARRVEHNAGRSGGRRPGRW